MKARHQYCSSMRYIKYTSFDTLPLIMQNPAMKQNIHARGSYPPGTGPHSHAYASASYTSSQGSFLSLDGISTAVGPPKPQLAWASVRHQVIKSGVAEDAVEEAEPIGTLAVYSSLTKQQ